MDLQNFQAVEIESINKFIQMASAEEIEFCISKMTADQIKSAVHWIDQEKELSMKKKIRAVILGLNQKDHLENAAHSLSLTQFSYLIDHTLQPEDKHHWKLSPVLMGLPFEVFSQFLFDATDLQLHVLQQEGLTEPIQHQLTLLCHEFSHQIEEIEDEIDDFCEEIDDLIVELLDRENVFELIYRIGLFAEFFEKLFQNVNKALAVAWNTNRLDLIENLNKTKDACQKYSIYGVGTPRAGKKDPTGLYTELEDILFEDFGDPHDTTNRDSLRHDEPAIEGLAKFSIWDIQDYWEMGLLPSIKERKKLELSPSKHSETERLAYRESLFCTAQKNLEKIELFTVLDLKRKFIFSKKTLREYVQSQSKQLQ